MRKGNKWLVLALTLLTHASALPIHSCTNLTSPGVYTLEADLSGAPHYKDFWSYCVGVFADDVVLEGNGHSISGSGLTTAGLLISAKNVTVKGVHISGYDDGVRVVNASKVTIVGSTISNVARNGLSVLRSSEVTISKNRILSEIVGLELSLSHGNRVEDNEFVRGGLFVYKSWSNEVRNNTVNGEPLVYLENARGVVVERAGQVVAVNSSEIVLKELKLSETSMGVVFWNVTNSRVENCRIAKNSLWGLHFENSRDNRVEDNELEGNKWYGVGLWNSSFVIVRGNKISNSETGIYFFESNRNSIYENSISVKSHGVSLHFSSDNEIYENNISTNKQDGIGILLHSSQGNIIHDNAISNNKEGIRLHYSSARIYDNEFADNVYDVTASDAREKLFTPLVERLSFWEWFGVLAVLGVASLVIRKKRKGCNE